jgi:H+-translocating NAD(P) transhydrogenase subunit alpha
VIVGVLKEAYAGETRVAATPTTVAALQKLGYEVVVEPGAGEAASFTDEAYGAAGARLDDPLATDVVIGVNAPTLAQRDRLEPGATLIAMLNPRLDEEIVADLAQRPISALSMDAVPRISRAQSMDVLSSMANVAGYRAVVEAAHEFGRMFTGQVTAAGKIPPARVFVVGAGVAGLAAIGAASAMGAVVRAFDVRPEVAEQVESMGAEFVKVEFEAEVSTDGYAKEMTAEQEAVTAAMYDEEACAADIVITTALIPGRPAPKLITEETIAAMRNGSVIVDMAAANGGNAALTKADRRIVTDNGVTIFGYTDLAGRLAAQSSQLYGTNIVNLLKLLTPGQDGELVLDFDDVVQRGITVVRDGESTWPPPPVQVSAAPLAPTASTAPVAEPKPAMSPGKRLGVVAAAAAVLFLLIGLAPGQLQLNLTVFALTIVIGYYVIGHVHHALHTPLMSVTNAISGIIVVGALLQIGKGDTTITVISFAAVLLASINIFGGFAVTRRMLAMFSRS